VSTHPALSEPIPGSDPALAADWKGIHVPAETKRKLRNSALLALSLRAQALDPTAVPLHGVQLLNGPPGTGKTTLARGLASEIHRVVGDDLGPVSMVLLNPHELASDLHGQTQRSVVKVLGEHVPALAEKGPTILILDEVEALFFSREAASTDTNPADLHRATDAALSSLDDLARSCPRLLTIATTNFPATVDEALISRADEVIEIGLPTVDAIEAMLRETIEAIGKALGGSGEPLQQLASDSRMREVAEQLDGLDGRQVRKFPVRVLADTDELTSHPAKLTLPALLEAAEGEGGSEGVVLKRAA
jgi:SpoVK/Ycf46/Vps4 family AAA+-type ATPase